jgi:hypothetical protein
MSERAEQGHFQRNILGRKGQTGHDRREEKRCEKGGERGKTGKNKVAALGLDPRTAGFQSQWI